MERKDPEKLLQTALKKPLTKHKGINENLAKATIKKLVHKTSPG